MSSHSGSLYVHIPFCRRRCFYCDFAIATGGLALQEKYISTLCQELELVHNQLPNSQPLKTIYFGGGTPSLLPVNLLAKVLDSIAKLFGIADDCEISLEANPDSLEFSQLQDYARLGVNRISLGVQAFQPELLKICGRDHTVEQIYSAIDYIQKSSIDNFSIDLISGLPQQTLSDWEYSLDQALLFAPHHLSIYDLIVEENTAFAKRYRHQQQILPTEETTVAMYLLTRERLTAQGYAHYEISNFARPHYQCKHNLNYWHNQDFYGVGMGATSYLQKQRIDRPRKMRDYLQMIADWQEQGIAPSAPVLSQSEELFDTLMQGLRIAEGISAYQLKNNFAPSLIAHLQQILQPFIDKGWLVWQSDRLCAVPPDGWLFSDTILEHLYQNLCISQDGKLVDFVYSNPRQAVRN